MSIRSRISAIAAAIALCAVTLAAAPAHAATDTQPPSTPQNLAVTDITSSSVALSWSPSTDDVGVTGYDILRAVGNNSFRLLTTVAGTSFTDSGLGSGIRYSYHVRARDAAGNISPLSNTVTAITHRAGYTGGGGAPCLVEYYKNEMQDIVNVAIVLTNTGTTTVNGWTLAWTFPGDTKITNGWNATFTQKGHAATAANWSSNATIASNNDIEFGFDGTWTKDDAAPTAFSMNGSSCAVG